MLRRVVLFLNTAIRGYYDESEVETLRDWIIKQAVKTAELAKLRTRATDGSSK
jgi:hypothetical protein